MSSNKKSATNTEIIFFGNEELSTGYTPTEATLLSSLLEAGYHVTALVLKKRPPSNRTQRLFAVEVVAHEHHIAIVEPANQAELLAFTKTQTAVLGVLAAFGMIVPQTVIDSFPRGIVNIHPSLLPCYRGSTPIEQAILDGVDQTGVSLMQLARRMDVGPIYIQKAMPLTGTETKQELSGRLAQLGAELLLETLPDILNGTLKASPQDDDGASYTNQISKGDGHLLPMEKSASTLAREICAYSGWPQSYFFHDTKRIIITKAIMVTTTLPPGQLVQQDGKLLLGCLENSLHIVELKPEGKGVTSATDFINGSSELGAIR